MECQSQRIQLDTEEVLMFITSTNQLNIIVSFHRIEHMAKFNVTSKRKWQRYNNIFLIFEPNINFTHFSHIGGTFKAFYRV